MSLNEIYSVLLSLPSNVEYFMVPSEANEKILWGIYYYGGIIRGYWGFYNGFICEFSEEITDFRL